MKKCVICGAEITGKYSNNRKYCSEACIRKHEATKYQDRITKRAKNINKVAHSVYRAYNSSCAICGWRATDELIISKGKIQYAYGNEIHHITPIISVDRTADGILRLYDPQNGKTYIKQEVLEYLKQLKYSKILPPKILRIDDKQFNLDVVNYIMEGVRK